MKAQRIAILLALLQAVTLPAASIHVAFHNGTTTLGGMTSRPAGAVVKSATQTWNNIVNTGGVGLTFTGYSLLDDQGVTSGATLSGYSGYSGYNNNGWGSQSQDYVMMEGWYGFRAAEYLAVSNLPPAFTSNGFTVVLYGDANSARTMNYTLAGVTKTIVDSSNFSGDLAPFRIAFSGLSNASFTITGNPSASDSRSAINGLQIVPTASLPFELAVRQFKATPARIQPGGTATLSWTVLGADRLFLSPDLGEVTALTTNGAGSIAVSPTHPVTYTLTVTNAQTNLSVTATARLVVGPPVPNILLFLVDDMGWQDTSEPFNYDAAGQALVSALNQRYRTPSMERLAARALKFTAAYAAPVCTPTRVSLMTGKSTARHRVTNWTSVSGAETDNAGLTSLRAPSGWLRTGLAVTETNTLPRLLGQAGYRTMHAGKAHFGSLGAFGQYPQNLGFDINIAGSEIGHPASYYGTNNFGTGSNHVPGLNQYHGSNIFLTEALTLEMNRQIERAVADGAPFFAYLAHYAVHTPWQNDPRFLANYPGLTGSDLAFATLIEGMDKSLGDVLDKLDALGVAENTLVVFLTDNGGDHGNAPLRNKKGTLYEGGVRVPLLIGWAKTNATNAFQAALPIRAGARVRESVVAWDLFPTLLQIAGIAAPAGIDGCDLGGYLRGETSFHRPQQFAIHFPHNRSNGAATQRPASLWRDGDWKLIYDYESGATQLYNLANDLSETNDLASAQPSRVMAMTRALTRDLLRLGALWPEQSSNGVPVPPVMPNLPAVDTDGDGLPDLTEDPNRNGVRDSGETDPGDPDTDGDRTPDGAEARTGTDPLDPQSNFVVLLAVTNGEPRLLSWPARAGATYRVEQSETLRPGSWTTVQDDLPGEDRILHFDLSSLPPALVKFFRVMLK